MYPFGRFLNPFAEKIQRRGFYFDLILALIIAGETLRRLLPFADPPGLNGYFYLKQTKTLANGFQFYFSDHSLAFAPLVLFRWLTGSDLHAFQCGIAFMLGAAIFAVCFLINEARASATEKLEAKLLVALALLSSSYFAEFALNFYKNFAAATLLLFTAAFLVRGQARVAFVFFCAAFLTHKSVALVGTIYLGIFTIELVYKRLRERDGLKQAAKVLAISGSLALLFGLLFLYHFPKARAFLHFAEESFAAPGARLQWWKALLLEHHHRASEFAVWAALLALSFFSYPQLTDTRLRILLTMAGIFLLAAHPFQPAGSAALGYRLILLLPLLAYPLAAFSLEGKYWVRAFTLLVLLAGSLPFASFPSFSSAVIAHEVRPYSPLLSDLMKIRGVVNPEDYLTSHHGMEFFVDYETDIRSRSFLAQPDFTGKRYRLVFARPDWTRASILGDELDMAKLLQVGDSYYLLREEDWENLNGWLQVPPTWKNPNRQRPAHVYE